MKIDRHIRPYNERRISCRKQAAALVALNCGIAGSHLQPGSKAVRIEAKQLVADFVGSTARGTSGNTGHCDLSRAFRKVDLAGHESIQRKRKSLTDSGNRINQECVCPL